MRILKQHTEPTPVDALTEHPRNPRRGDVDAIMESIRANGFYGTLIAQVSTGHVIAGNHRLKAAKALGYDELPVTWLDVDDDTALRILLADNRANDRADYDHDILADILAGIHADTGSLHGTLYDDADLAAMLSTVTLDDPTPPTRTLAARFGAPPFSVLDTRQGYWQERKREWMSLGIQSELGRDNLLAIKGQESLNAIRRRSHADSLTNVTGAPDLPEWANNGMARVAPGTSIFDPVLTELMIRWYSPPGGHVLDPFAGGSVRGVVSSTLGRRYTGVDLSDAQIDANRLQWTDIRPRLPTTKTDRPDPTWLHGDSLELLPTLDDPADLILTCPPYGDLERYSDDPADLSAMTYDDFRDALTGILRAAADRLRDDRFAVIIVSEYRLPNGTYAGLVPLTITALRDAGLHYYAEAALINVVGTAAIRAARAFTAGRKFTRTHQNVLVFVKGDARAAADACGDAEPAIANLPEPDDHDDIDATLA